MNKKFIAALMTPVMLLGITGCERHKDNDKVEITMYLWDKSMCKELTPWLEE